MALKDLSEISRDELREVMNIIFEPPENFFRQCFTIKRNVKIERLIELGKKSKIGPQRSAAKRQQRRIGGRG